MTRRIWARPLPLGSLGEALAKVQETISDAIHAIHAIGDFARDCRPPACAPSLCQPDPSKRKDPRIHAVPGSFACDQASCQDWPALT